MRVLSRRQIERWLDSGRLIKARSAVYRLAGAPVSWHQSLLAACLCVKPPVAASHWSAARLWRLDGLDRGQALELTVLRGRSARLAEVLVHWSTLGESDVARRERIPVTSIERTLVDLATLVEAKPLGRAVDEALRRKLTTPERLGLRVRQLPAGSRAVLLRRLLAERGAGVPGESYLEDTVAGWIAEEGLPPPVRQHQVVIDDRVFLLDLAYPDVLVAFECDGWRYHRSRSSFDGDRERAGELQLAGWLVIQITSGHTRGEVVSKVRRALAQPARRPGFAG